jgi:ABC-type glycerol-3-phosphate transport system permease component
MNVQTPLFPQPSNSVASLSNVSSTLAATDDLSGPSQHYWNMSQYLEISLPLMMAVILLPLVAGPCLRFASQQYEVHRRHWRALYVALAACYFVCLVSLTVASYLLFDPKVRSNDDLHIAYFIWSYSVLGMVCAVCMVRAYRRKQGRLRWSLQLLILTICLMPDVFAKGAVVTAVPWALLPFLSMFCTSNTGDRWINRGWTWLSWQTRRQSAIGCSSVTTV